MLIKRELLIVPLVFFIKHLFFPAFYAATWYFALHSWSLNGIYSKLITKKHAKLASVTSLAMNFWSIWRRTFWFYLASRLWLPLSPALSTQMSTYRTKRTKCNGVLLDWWSRAFTRYLSLSLSPRSDASDSTCLYFILCRCLCLSLSAQDDTITWYFMSKWWLNSPSNQLNLKCDLSPPSSLVKDSHQV